MLVISARPSSSNDDTSTNNKPQLRHRKIHDKLVQEGFKFSYTETPLETNKLAELKVIDPNMLKYFEECYNSSLDVNDSVYLDRSTGIIPSNMPKTIKNFDGVVGKLAYWRQTGLWCNDTVTPIKEDTFERIMISANNCYKAGLSKEKLIYCLNVDPGHHAGYKSYGGYCYINNAAVSALVHHYKHGRQCQNVAILDLDHHAGNGTENIFEYYRSVLSLSIHANPEYDYPFYSGHESEYNLVFNPGVTVNNYMNLVKNAMDKIVDFGPGVLVIPFGGDTYKHDPEASNSCKCCLDIEDYNKIAKYIRSRFDGKIIVTQEGGYDMNSIDSIVHSFLSGFI